MKQNLRKQVGLLTIRNIFIILAVILLEVMGGTRHFRRLVSLSPAMQHVPPKPKYIDIKKGLYHTLYVEETIEESCYVKGHIALNTNSYAHNHSDTVLNSTASYPIKSNITSKTQKTKKESQWLLLS